MGGCCSTEGNGKNKGNCDEPLIKKENQPLKQDDNVGVREDQLVHEQHVSEVSYQNTETRQKRSASEHDLVTDANSQLNDIIQNNRNSINERTFAEELDELRHIDSEVTVYEENKLILRTELFLVPNETHKITGLATDKGGTTPTVDLITEPREEPDYVKNIETLIVTERANAASYASTMPEVEPRNVDGTGIHIEKPAEIHSEDKIYKENNVELADQTVFEHLTTELVPQNQLAPRKGVSEMRQSGASSGTEMHIEKPHGIDSENGIYEGNKVDLSDQTVFEHLKTELVPRNQQAQGKDVSEKASLEQKVSITDFQEIIDEYFDRLAGAGKLDSSTTSEVNNTNEGTEQSSGIIDESESVSKTEFGKTTLHDDPIHPSDCVESVTRRTILHLDEGVRPSREKSSAVTIDKFSEVTFQETRTTHEELLFTTSQFDNTLNVHHSQSGDELDNQEIAMEEFTTAAEELLMMKEERSVEQKVVLNESTYKAFAETNVVALDNVYSIPESEKENKKETSGSEVIKEDFGADIYEPSLKDIADESKNEKAKCEEIKANFGADIQESSVKDNAEESENEKAKCEEINEDFSADQHNSSIKDDVEESKKEKEICEEMTGDFSAGQEDDAEESKKEKEICEEIKDDFSEAQKDDAEESMKEKEICEEIKDDFRADQKDDTEKSKEEKEICEEIKGDFSANRQESSVNGDTEENTNEKGKCTEINDDVIENKQKSLLEEDVNSEPQTLYYSLPPESSQNYASDEPEQEKVFLTEKADRRRPSLEDDTYTEDQTLYTSLHADDSENGATEIPKSEKAGENSEDTVSKVRKNSHDTDQVSNKDGGTDILDNVPLAKELQFVAEVNKITAEVSATTEQT